MAEDLITLLVYALKEIYKRNLRPFVSEIHRSYLNFFPFNGNSKTNAKSDYLFFSVSFWMIIHYSLVNIC